jgi:DNA-binding CsgD family transcriptional regulator
VEPSLPRPPRSSSEEAPTVTRSAGARRVNRTSKPETLATVRDVLIAEAVSAYPLSVATVVGRERELAAVTAYLGDMPGGRTLVIVGDPGIGKTTVWADAVDDARARAATVLVSRPSASEAKLAFAGLADLLVPVGEDRLGALPEPQRAALEVALLRAPARRAPGQRLVATAFLSLLRDLASHGGVVLAVDDLQWLDAPSAAAVGFVLRRLVAEPVWALLAVRSDDAGRSLVAELGHDDRLVRLELGPLTVAALHRILSNELGRTFPRPTLVRIGQLSGGNPLYALEIARLLEHDTGGDIARLPVPESLTTLVAARVGSLPAETRQALLRAAALARPVLRLVDAAALAPAEEAGLVRIAGGERIEFVHPLYASAVYSSAPLARRREMHGALAAAVSDPEEKARHLALACDGPDTQVARVLENAAVRARGRGAPDSAAELVELALRLLPEGDRSADKQLLDLARYLFLASDLERAAATLHDLVVRLPVGELRARALLALAEIEYWREGESEAAALVEQALLTAQDPLVRARCHVGIAMYSGTVDLLRARESVQAALVLLDEFPDADPALLATALGAQVRADLFLGAGFDADAADRALSLEADTPPEVVDTRIVFKLGQWLRYVDEFDAARSRFAEAEQAAQDEGDGSSLANILLNRMILETWAGNWGEATELTERMREAFDQQGVEVGGMAPWLVFVAAHAGRLESVRAVAERGRPREPIVAAILDKCLGLASLAAADGETADRCLSAALESIEQIGFREPAIWRIDGDAIEAALAVGDVERAERVLERFEQRAARSRIPWSLAVSARCRGLLLAARGDLEPAAAALERALVEHERSPVPFERARTLLVQGQVERRLKQKRRARLALEAARELFARLGTETWPARVDDELRRVAVRRAPAELSATELRIARLAADGLSNQSIAEQAFVSVKTVESNLKRAYLKLGISSRAQLARALDRRDAETIS